MRHLVMIGCLVLGACSAPIAPVAPPQAAPKTQNVDVTAPQIPPPTPAARASARMAVEDFLAVIEAIEPVAEQECRARAPRVNCDFRIVVDDRPGVPPNAYQTLDDNGRPILAFTIPLIVDVRNRDEMAFIMAHEAAHHIEGHLARQTQNANLGASVFGQIASVIGGANPEAIQAAQEFGAVIGARSYSKDFELEADALGVVIAARAGFDPLVGAEFFFRIPDPGDRFLGTHPANAERVRVVQRTAASLGF